MTKSPVLIVDDSPANLKVARVALESDGYEVRTAADGEEAWRILGSFRPSSILMDLQLPGLDGFELTQRIKADPALQDIRIIAVTAYAMKGDRERALAAGCDDYIAKPVDPTLLPALVARHLPQSSVTPPVRKLGGVGLILVIEDNPTTRKVIRVTLESDGYRTFEAADAHTALDWIEQHQPILIVQDLMLPDMDGLELVRKLRMKPHGREVPVLCLSGFLSRMQDANAMAHSFSELLVKPVDPVRMLESVRRHVQAPRAVPPTLASVTGRHVLLVDDDPLQRCLAEFQLVGAGFRVTAVTSASQALADAERIRPDVVVSDILMPEMDGFELCFAIRQHPRLAGVPVVLVSSHYSERSDRKLAERIGAIALVTRTGDCLGLIDEVRHALEPQPEPRPVADTANSRASILRRTLTQLERQLLATRRAEEECEFRSAQLSVLARIADALAQHTKLDDVLGDALSVCLDLAGISKGVVYLRQADTLAPKHSFGFTAGEVDALASCFGHAALLMEIVEAGQVRAIPSASHPADRFGDFLRRAGIRAALIVPVTWGEQSYGALLLGARTAEVTGPAAVSFARVLGGQLGQAIGLAQAFELLRASEEKFRALVDSMDDVIVLDRDQCITGAFGRWFERQRTDRSYMIGKKFQEIMPDDRASHDDAHARALAGESVLYEWSVEAESGVRNLQSTVFSVRDARGSVTSIMRVGRDVTEQRQMQTQMMVSDRMASVGMLAAGVAHEINNPLMAVLGNLRLMHEDSVSAAVSEPDMLGDALAAAERMEVIVRDLRLFSRAEDEHDSAVDVHEVLDSTLRLARNQICHRARLVREFGPIPAVHANAARLGQVFLNLVLNAAQAIPDGRADENEIRVRTYLDGSGRVVVEIADTGTGIPAELRAKLFTPFVTSKPASVGTGLGLAICQRIVTALGGAISFDSTVGEGTVFRVQLPADREPAKAVEPAPQAPAARRRGDVLIIDDDAMLCAVIARSLARSDNTVCMTDARQALALLGTGASFDVILCDVMMPHMTGAQFYSELERAYPEVARRTLFLTGGVFTLDAREFVERMGSRCLEKPVDYVVLRKFIDDHVG